MKLFLTVLSFVFFLVTSYSQLNSNYKPDFRKPSNIAGYKLVWNDEFNTNGKPDAKNWICENGFVRNNELQWYQPNNANCKNGLLIIEGRKEKVRNPKFNATSTDWRNNRKFANYTSASIQTKGRKQWQFGRFVIRARVDTAAGSWPAIWTLGVDKPWPSNGEIDVMEFYRINNLPMILANVAWGTDTPFVARWHTEKRPLEHFIKKDIDWVKKFHTWRMDWDEEGIKLFLDDELLNATPLSQTLNADGLNPFLQPHYVLLNLALGGNGGDPAKANKPIKYEVDYVRVYQKTATVK